MLYSFFSFKLCERLVFSQSAQVAHEEVSTFDLMVQFGPDKRRGKSAFGELFRPLRLPGLFYADSTNPTFLFCLLDVLADDDRTRGRIRTDLEAPGLLPRSGFVVFLLSLR